MRRLPKARALPLLTAALLAIGSSASAQTSQPEIVGFPDANAPATPFGTLLEDDSMLYFGVKLDNLANGEYAFVFTRMWVEAAVIEGQSVGAAVVAAMHASHPNLVPPASIQAIDVQLPGNCHLAPGSKNVELSIEKERIEDFLSDAFGSSNPESYGLPSNAGVWDMRALSSLPTNPDDERRAWGRPGVWTEGPAEVGHVSSLFHDTFEQSLFKMIGNAAYNLQSIGQLASFIHSNVTAEMVIHVVTVKPQPNEEVIIDFKIPVRIRRRSLKEGDNASNFLQEGVPTWFPTALFSAIHVAEAGELMTVPMDMPVSNLLLVWQRPDNAPSPYLIVEQERDSFASAYPRFRVPTTILSDLAGMGPMPFGYLLTTEYEPVNPSYNWGGAGGLVTAPMPNMRNTQN